MTPDPLERFCLSWFKRVLPQLPGPETLADRLTSDLREQMLCEVCAICGLGRDDHGGMKHPETDSDEFEPLVFVQQQPKVAEGALHPLSPPDVFGVVARIPEKDRCGQPGSRDE